MKTEEIQALKVPPQSSQSAAPATNDDATRELLLIWQEQLGVESVSPDQNFFDLGGDSSLAVRMFAEVEKIFGVKLPLATLYEAPTVEALARVLRMAAATEQASTSEASGWSSLVPIQPLGTRPRLFCMHGAGGTVLMYRDLARHLGDDQPFYGLQAQGLDGNSPPLNTVEEMAMVYVQEIRRLQAHGPYFIAGYCMGGTVAFEVAQQLKQTGEEVGLLALFDTMNWHTIPLTIWTKTSHARQQLFFHAASFLSLAPKGRGKFFREKYRELKNRIPVWRGILLSRLSKQASDTTSDSLVLARIWQTNDRASWNYIPQPYPGRIADIRPAKQYRVFSKPESKWDRLAKGGQDVIVLPVNPATMLVEPFVEHLAVAVRRAMDSVMEPRQAVPEIMVKNL